VGLVEDLKQHIASGETVIVVGSGVSIQATNNAPCASWIGLLDDGVAYAVQLGRLSKASAATTRKQIRSKDLDLLLGAAHTVTAKLGPDFGAWLQRGVGALRATNREVIEPLRSLGVLATTNYDHLLTEVTGLPPVPWTDEAAVEQVLRGRRDGILHLHGSYDDPESVILDVRSYERLVNSDHSQAVLTAIRTLKTLVFVGCGEGLSDPHFATFFKWTEKAFEKSIFPHFVLCRRKEVTKIRKQHLPERKLHPVAYGKEYSELSGFLASLASPRHVAKVLPASGPCFGREEEIRSIVDALLSDNPVRIAVLGTAGLGKTTLTLKALHDPRVQQRYGEAMHFIRCDAATSLDALIGLVATELGVTGTQQLARAVIGTLSAKPCVLVLDNFETPWQEKPLEVEEFLASLSAIDSLQLIVTLRGKERPAGVLWRDPVEPPLLPLPAAREAFLAIAGSRFANDPQLDTVLDAMGRLPLAISLFAYAAQSEPALDAVMKRWQTKRTAMLQRAGGKKRVNDFEVSFELSISSPRVTDEARRLLSVLAVLPAGIAHCDLGAVFENGYEVASVLRATGLAFDEGGRLTILAPLRAYVSDHYQPELQDDECMAAHYVQLTGQAQELGKAGGEAVLVSFSAEAPNIETAIVRTIQRGELESLAKPAVRYCMLVSTSGVGSVAPVQLLAIEAESKGNDGVLFNALEGLIWAALSVAPDDLAHEYCARALAIAKRRGAILWQANIIHDLGNIEGQLGRHEKAAKRFRQALKLFRQVKRGRGEADALASLGRVEIYRNRPKAARLRLEEARTLFKQLGIIAGEAFCIRQLGELLIKQGDLKGGRARIEQALPLFRQAGHLLHEASCYAKLGSICEQQSDIDGANANRHEALRRFERVRSPLNIGYVHRNLARTESAKRVEHLAAARAAWSSIGRDDLVKTLDEAHPTAN